MKKITSLLAIAALCALPATQGMVATPSDVAKKALLTELLNNCSFKGIALHGKVQFVDAFPDIKIQYVDAFPDIKVKWVDAFPDDCGEWKEVDAFPDFKVKVVDAFPDLKVKVVDAFPGMN